MIFEWSAQYLLSALPAKHSTLCFFECSAECSDSKALKTCYSNVLSSVIVNVLLAEYRKQLFFQWFAQCSVQ